MFSSNQVFEVSCTKSQLKSVLAFALDMANGERTSPRNLVYQTTPGWEIRHRVVSSGAKGGMANACVSNAFCGPACGSCYPVSEGLPGPLDRALGRFL